jgi:hypothetical protein
MRRPNENRSTSVFCDANAIPDKTPLRFIVIPSNARNLLLEPAWRIKSRSFAALRMTHY